MIKGLFASLEHLVKQELTKIRICVDKSRYLYLQLDKEELRVLLEEISSTSELVTSRTHLLESISVKTDHSFRHATLLEIEMHRHMSCSTGNSKDQMMALTGKL